MKKEELIFEIFKENNFKVYYDLGAYPIPESIELYYGLIEMNVEIYAFEPAQDSYNLLVDEFGDKIHSFPIGVGDKKETLYLYNMPDKNGASSFDKKYLLGRDDQSIKEARSDHSEVYTTEHEMIVLYDFIEENGLPYPDLIKMDVENWEHLILSTIDFTKHLPIITLSCHTIDAINGMKKYTKAYYELERYLFLGKFGNERKFFHLVPKQYFIK